MVTNMHIYAPLALGAVGAGVIAEHSISHNEAKSLNSAPVWLAAGGGALTLGGMVAGIAGAREFIAPSASLGPVKAVALGVGLIAGAALGSGIGAFRSS